MKVMIVVTHLLGTGHLSRALTLAHAFRSEGHDVLLASGGMPVPHLNADSLNLLQLPPLRSDGTNFTRLLCASAAPADEAYLNQRSDALARAQAAFEPDCLICELYPFGRRILSDEFDTLLSAARIQDRPPVVLSSIRDILAPPSKAAKAERTEDIICSRFDAVLVHSDPSVTRLNISWPVTKRLEPFLRYTGYVAPAPAGPHPDRAGSGDILVTSGGGPVGDELFHAALSAAARDSGRTWRLLVGGSNRDARIEALQRKAPTNAVVQPARPDFRQMLFHAAASVSMCGYNTTMDLLQAGTPAVLIPFDDGNEVEQTLRAKSLTGVPGIRTVSSADLSPETLLAALADVTTASKRSVAGFRFDGAADSVRIAQEMAEARP